MKVSEKRILWLRWVAANAFGELIGLGATFAVIGVLFTRLAQQPGVAAVLLAFVGAVASGALEATVLGLAQWRAMHPWLPTITQRAWWFATLLGALVAYVLGYLPSTLMDLGAEATTTPAAEPPPWIVLLLAAGLGAVGGAVLSFAQWRVLRKQVVHAAWWIPANMLAWLVGMLIIFWAMDAAFKGLSLVQAGLLIGGALFVTGAVVGAIHGAFLVWLANSTWQDQADLSPKWG